MKNYLLKLIGVFIFLQLFSACKLKEKLVYFNQNSNELTSTAVYTPIKIKVDDYLSVHVSDLDNETVSLFNTKLRSDNTEEFGYLVDISGQIALPVIGKVSVLGLTKTDAEALIATRLKEYLKNPIVQIRILNFKVTVLGDVKSPGTFNIKSQRLSVLDAIGLAGDLKMNGLRNNVLVLREDNGIKTEYRLNLTSKSVFSSPVYYLQQNDVVYVEPNFNSRMESTFFKTNGQIFISALAPILSIIILLRQ
jgi:polysaccharide export outer membrane protein